MRTTLLKKMSAVVLATLMVVAMFAGMAFSTSAADETIDITVGGKKTVAVAATDASIIVVDDSTTTVTIQLNTATTNTALWAAKGDYVQVVIDGEAINMTAGTTKEALGYKFVTVPMADFISAKEALNLDLASGTKDYTTYYGYEFTLTDGTTTAKYSAGDVVWTGTTLDFTKFIPAANVTLTVSGPNVVDGISTGRKAAANKGTFRASIAYKDNADLNMTETLLVKTLEKAAPAADTTTTNVELTTTAGITFGDKANWLSNNGMVLLDKGVENGIIYVIVDMKNNLIDETPVKFTVVDPAIAAKDNKATFTATDYNETFTVALTDGTYGLVRFTAVSNYDTDEAFTADMLVDLVKSSAFRSLKGLTSVVDGGIYVDMINAVVGQSNKYINWKQDGKTTTYTNDGFAIKSGTTKYTQADVNAKIALFGYFTEADGSITSKVQNYWGSFTFYQPNDVPGFNDKFTGVKDLYTGSATVLVYNDGTEDVQAILYHNDAATVLPIVMNDVTYNVPVFHIIRSDYTKAFAVGTAVTQQVATTVANAGSYSYSLTGSEMGLSKLVKEETKIALTLTSKVQLSHAFNKELTAAADADVVLVLRAPKNTTFTTSTKSTTTITQIAVPTATALTTTDGLVDYYFLVEYNTFADTTATIKMTYANGVWKEIDVKTTWLTTDKAIEGFTATIPASTTELVIALPERPIESQEEPSIETPVSSSTATPVESTPASSSTGSDLEVPSTGNPFSAVAYLITLCASAIGGISTLVIRKKK